MWLQIVGGIVRVGCVAIAAKAVPARLTEVFSISSAAFYLMYLIVIYALIKRQANS
jgi:hypothetical protein